MKYREAIEKASGNLPDEELLEVPNLAPLWTALSSYETDVRVCFEGILYRCIQGHIAQEDWTPPVAVSLWAKVLLPEQISQWEQPESTHPYQIGDRVRHNGNVWESIVADNVWEPGVYGWEVIP